MTLHMSATRSDMRGSLLLEVALDRAKLKERFAALLFSERARRGHGDPRSYPQPEMAHDLSMSLRQYQRWENPDDPSMPTTKDLMLVCEKLERNPAELFEDPEPELELEDKYELILGAIREQAQAEKRHHEHERKYHDQIDKRLRALEAMLRTRRSRKAKTDEPTR